MSSKTYTPLNFSIDEYVKKPSFIDFSYEVVSFLYLVLFPVLSEIFCYQNLGFLGGLLGPDVNLSFGPIIGKVTSPSSLPRPSFLDTLYPRNLLSHELCDVLGLQCCFRSLHSPSLLFVSLRLSTYYVDQV